MRQFIKSCLARMRKRVVPGRKEPVTNQESALAPYTPIVLADPPAPTVRKECGSKTWSIQAVEERAWNPGQLPVSGTSSPKPPLDTAPNYRLPFDILVLIFSHYARIEDKSSPLERILEVCHFWRDTALDHRTLWTTFHVRIKYSEEIAYWRKRFQQRADRLGPDALLDISMELVNRPVKPTLLPCGTYQFDDTGIIVDARQALGILKVVGGPRGAKAVRWKSLSLNVLDLGRLRDQDHVVLDRFLQARTPHLESLELYGIVTPYRDHKRILPYTPRLRRAVFHSCQLSHYPDTSRLASLTWYSIQDTSASPKRNGPAIHALQAAQKITVLEIGLDWTYWDTSLVFQRVKTLKMPAAVFPDFLIMIQVPSLRHLSLGLDSEAKFAYIRDCKGIPMGQVETLEIFHVPRAAQITAAEIRVANDVVVKGLRLLFAQMSNLRMLEWKEDMVRDEALLKSVLELFVGGSVGDEVIQKSGRMMRSG